MWAANLAVRLIALYVLIGVVAALLVACAVCAPLALGEVVVRKIKTVWSQNYSRRALHKGR